VSWYIISTPEVPKIKPVIPPKPIATINPYKYNNGVEKKKIPICIVDTQECNFKIEGIPTNKLVAVNIPLKFLFSPPTYI